MNITIRKATQQDLQAILNLMADDELGKSREAPSLPEKYSPSFLQIIESTFFDIFVMTDEKGSIIGSYQLMILPHLSHQGMKRAQIESVRIKKELRGQGLGRQLMQHAILQAQEQDCGMVQLTSNKARAEKAHRFYEALGFLASHEGFKLGLG